MQQPVQFLDVISALHAQQDQHQCQQQQLDSLVDPAGSEEFDQVLVVLASEVMQLRELHRTVTFQWINALDHMQKAIIVTAAYPYFAQLLTLSKLLSDMGWEAAAQIADPTRPADGNIA